MQALWIPVMSVVLASISMTITDDFVAGVIRGLGSAALAGAMVFPAMKAPDSLGRGIFGGIMFALAMAFGYLILAVAPITGGTASSIIEGFMGSSSQTLGAVILRGVGYTAVAFFVGFVVGMTTVAAGEVVKGGLIGVFVGSLVAGALNVLMVMYALPFSTAIFQGLVGLITWALFLTVAGGSDDRRIPKRRQKR